MNTVTRMTLQELSQYAKLHKQLERGEELLISLRAAACPGAQALTGMPHAAEVRDKVGDLAAEIADMETQVECLRKEAAQAECRIADFISTIAHDQTRMIFRLRFLRCLTWKSVAAVIGGRNTADSVKHLCYRYLETCPDVSPRGA